MEGHICKTDAADVLWLFCVLVVQNLQMVGEVYQNINNSLILE